MSSVLETYFSQLKELGHPNFYIAESSHQDNHTPLSSTELHTEEYSAPSTQKATSQVKEGGVIYEPPATTTKAPSHPVPPPTTTPDLAPIESSTLQPNNPLLTTREQLASLYYECKDCTACHLAQQRNSFVFGSGTANAEILVIGDVPSNEDDQGGLPFLGPDGELLTKMLSAIGLERTDLFLTNILKCRTQGTRQMTKEEALSCLPIIRRQIAIVKPKIILSLGVEPLNYLLSQENQLSKCHGTRFLYENTPLFVTFHPRDLNKKQSLKSQAWDDLQKFSILLKELL